MWYRSASFILDKQEQQRNDAVAQAAESRQLSPDSTAMAAAASENPNGNISMYYQTRAAHHGVVTSDWLAQAQAAVVGNSDDGVSENDVYGGEEKDRRFSVVDEFNNWRKQPDLAEAVAAIRALASVIRSSQAKTMMELEIELKRASDSLKVRRRFRFCRAYFSVCIQCICIIPTVCKFHILDELFD